MDMRRKERIDRGIKVRTEGIYAISSMAGDTLSGRAHGCFSSSGFFFCLLVLGFAPYWKRVVNIMCVYALIALSFDFLANYVGLVCLGGAFFVGVGGYLSAIFNMYLSIPFYLSIPLATVLGALLCTVLFLPCLPLRGVYFAIVTLMYPLLADANHRGL